MVVEAKERRPMLDEEARINALERDVHTHSYRLDALESERLPHRVASVEQNTVQIRVDVNKMERIWEGVQKTLAQQNVSMASHQQEIKTTLRTAGMIGAALMAIIQLLPYISRLL